MLGEMNWKTKNMLNMIRNFVNGGKKFLVNGVYCQWKLPAALDPNKISNKKIPNDKISTTTKLTTPGVGGKIPSSR